ncbi:glycoside hydrolase family 140 protein [Mucilaginibacter sp. SMC90]|uniref:glycoside hydrolase family 140 protein n=1 Tax=Mucilaginibacter sp. SMC90 TaxID=2929803 RepID=UPI001FB29476|nr:glycoside hydrolase family 140 protein [Mucilaginibacter sp. SMC90]UOE51040.1 glycoside hydrolase family 140 protein [Mucilaginibacter sp. SMC90]
MPMISMHRFAIFLLVLFCTQQVKAQFRVSENQHYILKNNKPFFWMGDTAWELFARLNREDADKYLKMRSEQGFTVIQAVALAELDGLHDPNPYGDKPLIDDDPAKPNDKYFQHVDYIIDRAESYHLNIALLPTWGDKLFKNSWGTGPEIFNAQNAAIYATWLAKRYKNKTNIIWILGGDRNPRDEKDIAVWRAMGKAIMKATDNKALISYHCQPNELGSAQWFRNEDWFSFNCFQNGHCRNEPIYDKMTASYKALPLKPSIDAEPIYEDHPVCFNAQDLGTSSSYDVRKYAYLDLFSGAFGHTYGCHDVWQMYSAKHEGVNGPHFYWYDALKLPGASQMQYVRNLMESHPLTDRIPDQSVIKENSLAAAERIQATRGTDYIFVYSSAGLPFTVLPAKIKAAQLKARWYNPRDGKVSPIGIISNAPKKFNPPTRGYGRDWVLILDDATKQYNL